MCESCRSTFGYYLGHNGFSESSHAYCDRCGMTCGLDALHVPAGVPLVRHREITSDVEPHLLPCECGGAFRAGASPRCPKCMAPLSAVLATAYIERNAPGTAGGYRWQRSWSGLYFIVINDRAVWEPWKT